MQQILVMVNILSLPRWVPAVRVARVLLVVRADQAVRVDQAVQADRTAQWDLAVRGKAGA